MQCSICRNGETRVGIATVTLNRENCTLIFKGVPAEICENCEEYYLSDETTRILLQRAAEAVNNGAEVKIMRFAA